MNNSTYIAEISYQIENWLHRNKTKESIKLEIEDLKEDEKFPPNLVFVDAYYDSFFGSSACAFLDTNFTQGYKGF